MTSASGTHGAHMHNYDSNYHARTIRPTHFLTTTVRFGSTEPLRAYALSGGRIDPLPLSLAHVRKILQIAAR